MSKSTHRAEDLHEDRHVNIPNETDLNNISGNSNNEPEENANYAQLLSVQQIIRQNKQQIIAFDKPIIYLNENALINPNTINIIQGPAGSHKSRFAEIICSVILSRMQNSDAFLGLSRNMEFNYSLCYIDSERNYKDQFPYALQSIQLKAGYKREDHPSNFDYLSIINIPRNERLNALQWYVERQREKFKNHLVLVFDVGTDFVMDFNRVDDSISLIDWWNRLINNQDTTILCVIHENPGQNNNKARGHLGTELMNKSSTVIQITNNLKEDLPNDIYKLTFLKCRVSKRPEPFYVRYSEALSGLGIVPDEEIETYSGNVEVKAPVEEIVKFLNANLNNYRMQKPKLIKLMIEHFQTSEKTLTGRLEEIIKKKMTITASTGKSGVLSKFKIGRDVYYQIKD